MRKKNGQGGTGFLDYLIWFPRIIFAAFIFVIVALSPMLIVATSQSFYERNMNEQCFTMIGEKDCRELQENARLFLKGDSQLDDRYSVQEQSHFADVKKIVDFGRALIFALLLFVALYFTALLFLNVSEIFATLKVAGIISTASLLLLLASIAVSFQGTFFLFHELLFPQGNWTFPFDSTIINVFSEQFFVHAATIAFLLSLGAGLILFGAGYLKKNSKQ